MPLYRQSALEGFRDAILERRLRAGQRIPSTRTLSAELRISRLPILNAFEQLVAEGYFESGVGSGTFVAKDVPGRADGPDRPSVPDMEPHRVRRPGASCESDFLLPKERDPWLAGWKRFASASQRWIAFRSASGQDWSAGTGERCTSGRGS